MEGVHLNLTVGDGSVVRRVFGYPNSECTQSVPLGMLLYGQTKDVVIRVAVASGSSAESALSGNLVFTSRGGSLTQPIPPCQLAESHGQAAAEIDAQRMRLQFVENVAAALDAAGDGSPANLANAWGLMERLSSRFETSGHQNVAALREDIWGQVREALARQDWFTQWGRLYLPSLARAHLTQQCNNFKDPGVQVYGGQLFEKARDVGDEAFLALPPPTAEDRSNIELLVAMGYPESEVTRALEAAYDNPDVAAMYLIEGIPAHRPPPLHQTHAVRPQATPAYSMFDYYDRGGG